MVLPWDFLANPWVQLVLSIPVYSVGLWYFGKSAYHSLRSGVPNMDVLIFIGAASALFYSVFGTIYFYGTHDVHLYLFYETGATIITLVLMGNVLEKRSVKKTTHALQSLSKLQVKTAKLIQENLSGVQIIEVDVESLKKDDVLQVNEGDVIPIDAVLVSGEADCDESMLSGESLPVHKVPGSLVFGGTLLVSGHMKVKVSSRLKDTVLSQIIEMVKKAQTNKPQIQKLGDRVSAVFVPAVILISVVTFIVSFFILDLGSAQSMLRAVAVLVISCPCAMGLATPTAIMVGIGKAAKRGILIKGGEVLENFAKAKEIVFDKTGTLTTGEFSFQNIWFKPGYENEAKARIFELEKHSSHPIAKALVKDKQDWNVSGFPFAKIIEEKGLGVSGIDDKGSLWKLGSAKYQNILDNTFDVYLCRDNETIAAFNMGDETKYGAKELLAYFNHAGVESTLLSGDKEEKVQHLAHELDMKHFYAEQLPLQKLSIIEEKLGQNPLIMVGDGINDAPALSKVHVGVSFAKGSDIAIQAANLVLMRKDLSALEEAHIISKQTYSTIKQNLFWAFFYNILCIPLAAAGFMHPMLGALSMAFSDVIVIGNSLWLGTKKVKATTPSELPPLNK